MPKRDFLYDLKLIVTLIVVSWCFKYSCSFYENAFSILLVTYTWFLSFLHSAVKTWCAQTRFAQTTFFRTWFPWLWLRRASHSKLQDYCSNDITLSLSLSHLYSPASLCVYISGLFHFKVYIQLSPGGFHDLLVSLEYTPTPDDICFFLVCMLFWQVFALPFEKAELNSAVFTEVIISILKEGKS
jgi:hypothetical protein